jgi:methionyl-tRNA formyltransferase
MSRIRVVFCGTPRFAVPSLKHLLEQKDFEIVGVFTQPDRPRGRGQEISYSPVKQLALAENIPVFQPAKVRAPEVQEQLRKLAPEVIVIIAYGQIIPARLLGIPKYGWINLHASLLPKYRGAAPINWAIVNGEARTGLTTMRIDAGMDTGEMLLQEELAIGADETAPQLMVRLAEVGAPLMVKTLRGLVAETMRARAQNHAEATLAPPLKRADGRIEWTRPAEEIYNRMRGFAPWPGAYTEAAYWSWETSN